MRLEDQDRWNLRRALLLFAVMFSFLVVYPGASIDVPREAIDAGYLQGLSARLSSQMFLGRALVGALFAAVAIESFSWLFVRMRRFLMRRIG
jgi:hypothetical protein